VATTTHTAQLDTALEDLAAAKQFWARLPIADKIGHLDAIHANTVRLARPWVEAAVEAKGTSIDDQLAGEEWTSGPYSLLSVVHDLRETLVRLDAGHRPIDGHRTRILANGQVAVDVFPSTLDDRLLYSGVHAEVWMQPEVTLDTLEATVASFYGVEDPSGSVSVVLAAGNIASIAPLDVLHAMFNDGEVAILKMNPVNDYLGAVLEEIFADLVSDGFLRFAYGGVEVGKYLTSHPMADTVHVTGHASTYEAIVFGAGEDGERNRTNDTPINERPVGAELGGVGAIIVVPGPWSKRDVRFHAEQIVSTKMHNGGFNCIAAQVLVVPRDWELTEALIDEVARVYASATDRVPYYPGTGERCAAAIDRRESVDVFGDNDLRYLIHDLDPDADDAFFTTEVFGPVLAVTEIPSPDVASYLKKAARFVNDRLYGTLGVNIMIHPRTERRHGSAFQQMLTDLEYGTIAINTWTGVAYFLPKCAWGAYPGHPRTDIQSGTGFVHNTLMFDKAQKSVVRGPFAPAERAWLKGTFNLAPKPIFYVTNATAHVTGERLIAYMDTHSKADLMRVASSAIRG
jgi:Aldehyde dehydrogenase family